MPITAFTSVTGLIPLLFSYDRKAMTNAVVYVMASKRLRGGQGGAGGGSPSPGAWGGGARRGRGAGSPIGDDCGEAEARELLLVGLLLGHPRLDTSEGACGSMGVADSCRAGSGGPRVEVIPGFGGNVSQVPSMTLTCEGLPLVRNLEGVPAGVDLHRPAPHCAPATKRPTMSNNGVATARQSQAYVSQRRPAYSLFAEHTGKARLCGADMGLRGLRVPLTVVRPFFGGAGALGAGLRREACEAFISGPPSSRSVQFGMRGVAAGNMRLSLIMQGARAERVSCQRNTPAPTAWAVDGNSSPTAPG